MTSPRVGETRALLKKLHGGIGSARCRRNAAKYSRAWASVGQRARRSASRSFRYTTRTPHKSSTARALAFARGALPRAVWTLPFSAGSCEVVETFEQMRSDVGNRRGQHAEPSPRELVAPVFHSRSSYFVQHREKQFSGGLDPCVELVARLPTERSRHGSRELHVAFRNGSTSAETRTTTRRLRALSYANQSLIQHLKDRRSMSARDTCSARGAASEFLWS